MEPRQNSTQTSKSPAFQMMPPPLRAMPRRSNDYIPQRQQQREKISPLRFRHSGSRSQFSRPPPEMPQAQPSNVNMNERLMLMGEIHQIRMNIVKLGVQRNKD